MLLGLAALAPRVVKALPVRPTMGGDESVSAVSPLPIRVQADTTLVRPPLPDSLATITTDTGVFAPGPASFARFTVPGLCRAAALYASTVQRQTRAAQGVLDTIHLTAPTRDTLPRQAVTLARTCGARFTVKETPVPELPDLFALALQAGNDTLAEAVMRRQLALAASPTERGTVLMTAIGGYLTAEPARVSAVEAIVAQVDALGPTMQGVRLAVHDSLLRFAESSYDTVYMRQEAERIIALGHDIPTDYHQYAYDPVVDAYRALLEITFVAHPDALPALAARAKEDLSRFPAGRRFPSDASWTEQIPDYKTASLDAVSRWLAPAELQEAIQGQMPSPPPLQASYWFPARPAHWPPGTGSISLVVYSGHGPCLGGITGGGSYNACGWNNVGAGVHTALARYAALGLPITIVVETWRNALGQLPASVVTNADTLRWFYRDHLKLPVTVAVVADSLQELPTPDGRLFPCDADGSVVCWDRSANAQRYLSLSRPVLLLGKRGELLYSGALQWADGQSRAFSPLFDALLRHQLALPSSPLGSTGAPGGSHPSLPLQGTDVTR